MHKCYNYTKIKKGEPNLEKLKNCLDKWGHYKVFVFAATKQSVYDLYESLKDYECKVYAVSFPYKEEFIINKGEGQEEEYIPETSRENVREEFANKNIVLIQGCMPFDEIILPGVYDAKIRTLTSTLSMISKGLVLCIQAVLMASDSGYAEPGEDVIAMAADTAVIVKSCQKKWLFHPEKGLKIKEILCKPLFEI